jgi:hypothetical protein
MGTPISAQARTCASWSKLVRKLKLYKPQFDACKAPTNCRTTGSGSKPAPIAPMPPAMLTAAANCGDQPANAMPACVKAWRML